MSQSQFSITLPSQDNAGNALTIGQITGLVFEVVSGTPVVSTPYAYAVPSSTPVGGSIVVPFSALGFAPVGGQTYAADAYAVDANGNGIATPAITWTEDTVPAAPTGFSVS